MSLSLVAALGNPGSEYAQTRHNLGWMVIDAFAEHHRLTWRVDRAFKADLARWTDPAGREFLLAKPLTYMNDSGRPTQSLTGYYKVPGDRVVVLHDDINLDLGRVKVSVGGGPGGHNGLISLIAHLGAGFTRYRLGIGPRAPREMDLKDFVLGRFSPEQLTLVVSSLKTYVAGLELLLTRSAPEAMNRLNRTPPHEPDQTPIPRDLHPR